MRTAWQEVEGKPWEIKQVTHVEEVHKHWLKGSRPSERLRCSALNYRKRIQNRKQN